MTKEEIISKYGDVQLTFASYYKYSFAYEGKAEDGSVISASVGGNSDEIYRYSVSRDSTTTLKADEWMYASVHKDGQEVWSEYRY